MAGRLYETEFSSIPERFPLMKLRRRTLLKTFRTGLMLLPVLAMAACSDGTSVEPYVGFYDMTQFEGKPLPAGDGSIFIRSGVIELRTGSRFRLEMDNDYLVDGAWITDPVLDEGTFTITNGALLLNTDPSPLTGAIFPDHIRLNDGNPGSIWVKRE